MKFKAAFAMIGVAAWVAGCQEAPDMPTARDQDVESALSGGPAPGWSAGKALVPAAVALQVSESGLISLTQDGVGTTLASGVVTLVKTAGATARRCFLASTTAFSSTLAGGDVTIDGAGVTYSQSIGNGFVGGFNYFGEVTALVKPKFDAAPVGSVNFTIVQPTDRFINGHILSCVLNDPSQPTTSTVLILFGHQNNAGDSFQITHPVPVDLLNPTPLVFDISLGIGHSQQVPAPGIGTQVTIVDVNTQRLTGCAGHSDDTDGTTLLTVGGTGDSNLNPPPTCTAPPPGPDDELYNLVPFISTGETTTTVITQNPSNDDTVFYVSVFLNRAAGIGAPQCSDGTDNDGDGLIDFPADPGCTSAGDATESPNPPPPGGSCPAPGGNVLTGRSFLGIVLFLGTEGDDVAVGLPGRRNVFFMRGGNDTANGADLQDSFFGGEGDDTWCGGGGSDAAFGDRGSDNLTGSDGFDRNDGGHGGPPNGNDTDTDICFGEANFLCEQSSPDGVVISSMRFKRDVTYVLPDDRAILGLRPVLFRYREPYVRSAPGFRAGLIAEDVAQVFPDAVVYEGNGSPMGIRYSVLGSGLIDRVGRRAAERLRNGVTRLAAMVE